MMPCWMYIGSVIFREQKIHIKIPYLSMFFQLLFAVSPLILGMIIRQCKLSFAQKMEKIIKPMLLFFILFFLSFGLWVNLPLLRAWTWSFLFTGALLPWLGYLLAGTFAYICRANRRNIITIAIEAGMQNVGMVIMFFEFSFQPPETELGLIYPLTATFMTTKPFWIIYLILKLVRFIRKKKLIQKHLDTGNYILIEVKKTKDLTENLILDEGKDEFEVYSPKGCAGKLSSQSELKLLPVHYQCKPIPK
ncbi:hypothetical protein SNEBB_010172 [Seison nebaliae]|nr:hypothetical protein SNEBB_010172 [Seison nebaliae]